MKQSTEGSGIVPGNLRDTNHTKKQVTTLQ